MKQTNKDNAIKQAAATLVGMRLDSKQTDKEIPFPPKNDLDRKFCMNVDDNGKTRVVEISAD